MTPAGPWGILPTVREYRFVHVDVFTDRILAGNPLAVLLDGRGLSDGEMHGITREMNLSETTFILPVTRGDCAARARIFTPGRELPFAGHPTLGTSWVLATQGLLPPGTRRFALEEGIGPVPVEFEGDPSRPSFVWMSHGQPEFERAPVTPRAMATALGLEEVDLLREAPIEFGSTGTPFLFVPVRDRRAVDRLAPSGPALRECTAGRSVGVFVFAPDPDPGAGRVYSRMFAAFGPSVWEDPATGSASGPLGAYLVRHRLVKAGHDVAIVSEQGTQMGRPSFIHIRLRCRGEDVEALRVGGGVVPVLEGVLRLP